MISLPGMMNIYIYIYIIIYIPVYPCVWYALGINYRRLTLNNSLCDTIASEFVCGYMIYIYIYISRDIAHT